MTRKIDGDTAAQLLGSLAPNPVGAVRSLVESAIAIAVPAQRRLGRIADGEVPSDPEALSEALRDLEIARQLLGTAAETLRVVMEDVRPTSPGGSA
jgi:pilus assembly protein TadC